MGNNFEDIHALYPLMKPQILSLSSWTVEQLNSWTVEQLNSWTLYHPHHHINSTVPICHRLSDVIEPFWLGFWLDWQCLCGLKTRSRQCVIEQGQLGEEKGGFVLVQPIEMDWWSVVQSVAVKSLKRQLASYFLAMPRMGGFRKSDPVIFPPENDSGEIRNRFSFHSASWDE